MSIPKYNFTAKQNFFGKVHAGFSKAFEQIAADIQKSLAKKKYQEKSLFITGHSLGGALATVAIKRLTHEAGISACYTFGSPRIANKNWIVGIKTPIYRLVNAADPVPMLPPSSFGYFHCGNMRLHILPTVQKENMKMCSCYIM